MKILTFVTTSGKRELTDPARPDHLPYISRNRNVPHWPMQKQRTILTKSRRAELFPEKFGRAKKKKEKKKAEARDVPQAYARGKEKERERNRREVTMYMCMQETSLRLVVKNKCRAVVSGQGSHNSVLHEPSLANGNFPGRRLRRVIRVITCSPVSPARPKKISQVGCDRCRSILIP